MTRDEYHIKVWQDYYTEARQRGSLTPTAYAEQRTAQHMHWADSLNQVPWDMPEPEGAGE